MPLRPAQPADAPSVTGIFQAARRHSLPFLPTLHTDAQDHAFFARLVAADTTTVAEDDDGAIAGFITVQGGSIDHLYVHPDQHRRGFGRLLLRAAMAGRERLELWVFERNTGAIAFYEAHGFAIVSSTDGAENEESEPDHLMAWSLR
jgi:ribosomal protein S18 acetylase RimI-like enzyme